MNRRNNNNNNNGYRRNAGEEHGFANQQQQYYDERPGPSRNNNNHNGNGDGNYRYNGARNNNNDRRPPNRNNPTFRRSGISNSPRENVRAPVVAREPPTGQHLSKTTSELKNDPLYLEAFVPAAAEELVPIAEELNHFTGFEGLAPLVNESYENLCAHSLNFKRSISLSMYNYYITVFAWTRVLYIKKKNRYPLTSFELELIEMVYTEGNYVVPKSIVLYLSGFGNFNIPSSVESKFNLKDYKYDANGYFNDMESAYYLTASYPNISLSAERISYDLAFTDDPNIGAAWQPNEVAREWNSRCIGYADSVHLSDMQRAVLANASITSENFPADINGFRISVRLMNSVSKYLLEVPSLESGPIPTNVTGSQGQLIIDVVDERVAQLRALNDIGAASYVAKSPFHVAGPTSYLGGSFMYRVEKALTPAQARFFFPFNIPHPTQAQIAVLNTLNTGWSPLLTDVAHLANVPFKPELRVKKITSIDVKLAST